MLKIVGGHYTYAEVPLFDAFKEWFGFVICGIRNRIWRWRCWGLWLRWWCWVGGMIGR